MGYYPAQVTRHAFDQNLAIAFDIVKTLDPISHNVALIKREKNTGRQAGLTERKEYKYIYTSRTIL